LVPQADPDILAEMYWIGDTRVARSAGRLLGGLGLILLACTAQAAEFRGRVVGVTDGDTLTVLHDSRAEKVRLNGIDTPEQGQPYSQRAKQATASLAMKQLVTVQVRTLDRYGRTVADVRLPDGRLLNEVLVRAGYAWWFRRYSADPRLATAEAEARAARVGLWADPLPVPPWEWRATGRARFRGSGPLGARPTSVR
jgi:endonuclease YncB( thermonuclease family)